jgi:succinyl-CoA synthetase beta subunit
MHRAFSIVIIFLGAMNILEFQSKKFCRQFGIPVPESILINNIQPIQNRSIQLKFPLILKAQVASKKRARRGGICLARSWEEAASFSSTMFTTLIDEQPVHRILVEEMVDFQSGFSVSFARDVNDHSIYMTASQSFSSLEENGARTDQIENEIKYVIDPYYGVLDTMSHELCSVLELDRENWEAFISILGNLWKLFSCLELKQLDINPLVLSGSRFFVLGIDIEIDKYALFRHPELENIVTYACTNDLAVNLSKLDCDFSIMDGNICAISQSIEMSTAIRDVIKTNHLEASALVGMHGNLFLQRIHRILETVQNHSSSMCVIIHFLDSASVIAEMMDGIREYCSGSENPLPILVRIPGLEGSKQPEDSENLINIPSLEDLISIVKHVLDRTN